MPGRPGIAGMPGAPDTPGMAGIPGMPGAPETPGMAGMGRPEMLGKPPVGRGIEGTGIVSAIWMLDRARQGSCQSGRRHTAARH